MNVTRCLPFAGCRGFLALALSCATFAATAQSEAPAVSELLEKGIHSEENLNDPDAAIKLYEQVIAEAKGSQALAAQAQYRLGVCHYRKKNFTEATAAFEKLARDYPDQKELVALANEYLAGAIEMSPVPWTDGEELRLDLRFGSGIKIGSVLYSVEAAERDGRKTWRFKTRTFAMVNQSFSTVEAEAESMKPIQSRWKHSMLGDATATYRAEAAEIRLKGKDEVKSIKLDGVIYDNEEATHWMRRLPFGNGHTTTMKVLTSLGGGSIVPIKLMTSGPEKVTVPAGTFDCYRVDLSINQTFWYSADERRYLVKFEAGGVIAELSTVGRIDKSDRIAFRHPGGFSFSLPSGWAVIDAEEPGDGRSVKHLLLDPEASAFSLLHVRPMDDLKPEARKSVQDWANSDVARAARSEKDWQLDTNSWRELKLGNGAAISVVAEYSDKMSRLPSKAYGVWAFEGTNAVHFRFWAGNADFESLLSQWDSIVASYVSNP